MLVTDYYKFRQVLSGTRFDEEVSTGCYAPFEALRNKRGKLFIHISGVGEICIHASHKKKFSPSVSKASHISTINGFEKGAFYWSSSYTYFGYGDLEGSQDAILFVYDAFRRMMEVFIIRGCKHLTLTLYSFLKEGRLRADMEFLRKRGRAF